VSSLVDNVNDDVEDTLSEQRILFFDLYDSETKETIYYLMTMMINKKYIDQMIES
jgi:hypothetical protein